MLNETVAVSAPFQEESKRPLLAGRVAAGFTLNLLDTPGLLDGRGLHSSTFRLNVSAFCGIGGAFRGGCLGGVQEVSSAIWGCKGCI